MTKSRYADFNALNPYFDIVLEGLTGLVDGKHFFDTIGDDAVFDFRYDFPGWPRTIRGRAALMEQFSGYGSSIKLHSADGLVVHRSLDSRIVILEYDVHGTILATGVSYENRFSSVITIENRKIVHWRDYMDSLAAWTVLSAKTVTGGSSRA
jgi:ketosteroid isomerase-like protein